MITKEVFHNVCGKRVEDCDCQNPQISPQTDKGEVKKAFDVIKAAMEADGPSEPGGYAHTWHCNLAMCFYDELMDSKSDDAHVICNDAASRFMKLCFGVETKA